MVALSRNAEFTFSPDPEEQPQASLFWPLLTDEEEAVVQEAREREIDDRLFKYVGVGGVDQPRIVQVGFEATYLDVLADRVGLPRAVDNRLHRLTISRAKRRAPNPRSHPSRSKLLGCLTLPAFYKGRGRDGLVR